MFGRQCTPQFPRYVFKVFSEVRKYDLTLCSHPRYRGGELYDFCTVKFEWEKKNGDVEVGYFPSKLIGFFRHVPTKVGECLILSSVDQDESNPLEFTLVHPCAYQTEQEKSKGSRLIEHWTLGTERVAGRYHPKYQAVPHSAMNDPCLVIEEERGLSVALPCLVDWSGIKLTD